MPPTSLSPSLPSAAKERSVPIDILRAVAILLVLGCHYVMLPVNLGAVQPLAAGWRHIGWAGVDLFFVLSGYLVSGLLFSEYRKRGRVDIRRFLVRRGFKIWPAYAVYLAFLVAWLAVKDGWTGVATLWPNFVHLQSYFLSPRPHTWSLAVEEHFYAGVAFLLWWLAARRRPEAAFAALPWGIGVAVATISVLRYFAFRAQGATHLNLFATHLRCDGLLVGTLIAWWANFRPEQLARVTARPGWLVATGLICVAPVLVTTPIASAWSASAGLSALYLGFGLVVMAAAACRAGWLAAWPCRLLARIGFFSYGIYLWHVDLAQTPAKKLVALLAAKGLPAEVIWCVATGLYVVDAILLGMALSWLIERPALAARDRLFPAAGAKPVPTPAGPVAADNPSAVAVA